MSQSVNQQPIVVPPGGGQEIAFNGGSFIHKVKSRDTNGVFAVMEIVTPPGSGIDLHVHENEDELVSLLEGEIEVTLGDKTMKAVTGVIALLPRGIPHGFTNTGEIASRISVTILPGDFDNYFVELAELYKNGQPTMEQIDRLSKKYAIQYIQ